MIGAVKMLFLLFNFRPVSAYAGSGVSYPYDPVRQRSHHIFCIHCTILDSFFIYIDKATA